MLGTSEGGIHCRELGVRVLEAERAKKTEANVDVGTERGINRPRLSQHREEASRKEVLSGAAPQARHSAH